MKNQIIITGILILLIGIAFSSCSDALDIPNPNEIEERNFWKNEKDALMGLASVYDAFQTSNLMGLSYRGFDQLADNATSATGNDWRAIEYDTHLPSNKLILGIWSDLYVVIFRANSVIDKVALIADIEETSRQRIISEAKFLRAYAYYDLTALWGNVPFYLRPKSGNDQPEAATSQATIHDYLIQQFDSIIPYLPETVPPVENGRIPKAAAQALLGKYYLTERKWAEAAAVLNQIIKSNRYVLYPDYGGLFTPTGEFSSESLFEINFKAQTVDQGETFSVRIDTLSAPIVPSRMWKPIPSLVNSYLASDGKPINTHPLYGPKSPLYVSKTPYENRDPRLRANIYTNADNTPGGKKIWNWTNVNSFAPKKYSYLSGEQFPEGGPQNYYVIRYADVLLMYAEAQNEYTGPTDSVYSAVNAVRRRVKMPDIPTGLSQENMRQYIRDERRWEFAMERQRYFDLKRWGILGPASSAALSTKKYSEPRIFAWPYPQLEMDRNAALRQQGQNAGY